MSLLLATTRAGDLQALGTGGQSAAGSWSVLHSVLRQRLGSAHAALLAEPMTNAAQGETDWYAPGQAAAPLASLSPEAAAAARATLDRLVDEVRGLADALSAGTTPGERVLGTMLGLALQVPGEEYVFVADGQPVLVAWGHARAGATAHKVVLTGRGGGSGRAAPPRRAAMTILPPPAPLPPPASRLGAALVGSLLASLLLLLGAGFLLARDPLGWYAGAPAICAVPSEEMPLRARLDAAGDREGELRLRLAQLTTDAGARRLRCAPIEVASPAPPPPPTPPPTLAPSQDQQRAQNRGGASGKLTIILAWDDRNDLDLHVQCPGGGVVWFHQRRNCGGVLDVDANENSRTADVQPVENLFFAQPAPGEYRVFVDPYAMRVAAETPFRITIQQESQPDRVVNGVARNGQRRQQVTTVVVGAGR